MNFSFSHAPVTSHSFIVLMIVAFKLTTIRFALVGLVLCIMFFNHTINLTILSCCFSIFTFSFTSISTFICD